MAQQASTGTCLLCGGTFSKSKMTRHLTACGARARENAVGGRRKAKEGQLFHIIVEGRYVNDYWLHLEMPAMTPLDKLDAYLRDIWLECCGHLSEFTINGVHYNVIGGDDVDFLGGMVGMETGSMQGRA